jgi:hypothetical protein
MLITQRKIMARASGVKYTSCVIPLWVYSKTARVYCNKIKMQASNTWKK